MPRLYRIFGYIVYFWSNEENEPVHVHICKSRPTENATKFWITSSGNLLMCHNKSRIPSNDLRKIVDYLSANTLNICEEWFRCFGSIGYYC